MIFLDIISSAAALATAAITSVPSLAIETVVPTPDSFWLKRYQLSEVSRTPAISLEAAYVTARNRKLMDSEGSSTPRCSQRIRTTLRYCLCPACLNILGPCTTNIDAIVYVSQRESAGLSSAEFQFNKSSSDPEAVSAFKQVSIVTCDM
ncbi:hypothetical protein CPB84DRAFT_1845616 [Gymnopilus junonius]|uniref:Uncharacterized protein n=1 Tax=Gymnopilus junonius TaxID=109634 RepID=A0A9P5TQN7_GYMJU|nr:hypothetical protein CPB84DRAFT_1845616 [Gymnopilus junonius]